VKIPGSEQSALYRAGGRGRVMVAATIALGLGILAAAVFKTMGAWSTTLALLCAAAVLTELIEVAGDPQSLDPVEATSLKFSAGIHLAAAVMVGPWQAAIVAAFGVLAVDRLRGSSWRRVLFNASAFAVSAFACGSVYVLLGGTPGTLRLPDAFAPFLVAAITYAFTASALVSTAFALSSSRKPWPFLCRSIESALPVRAAETGFGLAFAFFALTDAWLIVALVPLAAAQYQARARLRLLRSETSYALETFANVLDERDPSTFHHSVRVAQYASELAEALGLPQIEVARLRLAGRLHDLGKMSVDARVLRKPGSLDEDEWTSIQRHPRLSARLLRRFRFASEEARAVEYHHERYDGAGYYGVEQESIPLASHFLIVADSFDAMTSDRPYRAELSRADALAEIEANLGSHFHPAIGRAFIAHQRGFDPVSVLTPDELAELRRPSLSGRRVTFSLWALLRRRPELLVYAGVVGVLLAVSVSRLLPAVVGVGVAAAGLAVRGYTNIRARRLSASLRLGLAVDGAGREPLFHGLVGRLAAGTRLRWAGLVAWDREELAGSLELEWAAARNGPTETGLTSWLTRDAEAQAEMLHIAGSELGCGGSFIALTLQRDDEPAGYLVLGLAHAAPRYLELALEDSRDLLLERLTRARPAPGTARPGRHLAAVS
jgi:putative nucleotidyltransferase with HDIG domain